MLTNTHVIPLSGAERRQTWPRWLLAWAALWWLAWLAGPWLLRVVAPMLGAHDHAMTSPFVDVRSWWGIPNTVDVLTNLPFALVGAFGLAVLAARRQMLVPTVRLAMGLIFGGLVLTALGSAWFHWDVTPFTLVADRMGMAVTFAGVLALAAAEKLGLRAARVMLPLTLCMGIIGAALPWIGGNVLPWAVLQFGGVLVVACLVWRPAQPQALGVRLGALVAWYVLAKVLEWQDEQIYLWTDGLVAGHALKHVAAALAVWPVLRALRDSGTMRRTKEPLR